MTTTSAGDATSALSRVLLGLMRGVTYQESDPQLWQALLAVRPRIREYVGLLGLELIVDETEGYAYLRQRATVEGDPDLPRLVQRRQLGYPVSILLALLRRKLAESDAASGDTRVILARDEIVELLRLFLPDTLNQARLTDRIDSHINRVIELGFLRRLPGAEARFEVRRIIKAFVDAQWLATLNERLAAYKDFAALGSAPEKP